MSVHDEIAAARKLQEDSLLSQTANSYHGRAVLWAIMEEARVDEMSFVAGAPDVTAFQEGKRNVAKWLRDWLLTVAPDVDIIMRREARAREEEYVLRTDHEGIENDG